MNYKTVDLFGNETIVNSEPKKKESKNVLFEDYDSFVEKFEPKKTTDDCYTPPKVYKVILDFVRENIDLTKLEIIRPFYPGGDYEAIDYPENAIVIDNPPFSIISKIARFYTKHGIKFFLFAPHLTLFSAELDCTKIVTCSDITYENGAKVKTSFLSNIFGDVEVMTSVKLHLAIKEANKIEGVKKLPKYNYPPDLITVSDLSKLITSGQDIEFKKSEVIRTSVLDAQRKIKKAIFGSGYLISEKKRAEIEKKRAEIEKKRAEIEDNVIVFELSEAEKLAIKKLTS